MAHFYRYRLERFSHDPIPQISHQLDPVQVRIRFLGFLEGNGAILREIFKGFYLMLNLSFPLMMPCVTVGVKKILDPIIRFLAHFVEK